MAISGNPSGSSSSIVKQTRPTSILASPQAAALNRNRSNSAGPTMMSSSSATAAASSAVTHPINEETCRRVASTLVDTLVAKAIVKASQELAFHHTKVMKKHQSEAPTPVPTVNSIMPQASRSGLHNSCPNGGHRHKSAHKFVENIDINGNPPEIQIDLVGPRTPSPVEESSFEMPSAPQKKYKFKVAYDAESMCNAEEYSGEESSSADPDLESTSSYCNLQEDELSTNKNINQNHQTGNSSSAQVDVATTPELVRSVYAVISMTMTQTTDQQEMDLEQAQEMSKHIVTEIINQAVDILNKENNHNHLFTKQSLHNNMKREPESYSKISCHSSRTAASVGNNCTWINRARHALSRLMRNACLCTKDTKDTAFHV